MGGFSNIRFPLGGDVPPPFSEGYTTVSVVEWNDKSLRGLMGFFGKVLKNFFET